LAILGDEDERHRGLTQALDQAEACGAIILAAAGNQGRLATGQILSHPVAIPVVAVDETGRLLPDCNFGPSILRRGVAALGRLARGYAPGGGTTTMSGTSVATAFATGILAQVWATRPDADSAIIRAAVARLTPRCGPAPPLLTKSALLAALSQNNALPTVPASLANDDNKTNCVKLQGGTTMNDDSGLPSMPNCSVASAVMPGQTAAPAHVLGGCSCGGAPGSCTCGHGGPSPSSFVYVLGTVDVRFPDQSIADELERVAEAKRLMREPQEDLRTWCYRILTDQQATSVGAGRSDVRYIARQLVPGIIDARDVV
jgi:hypothetical protein